MSNEVVAQTVLTSHSLRKRKRRVISEHLSLHR